MEKKLEEKNIYLYELSNERFKEIKAVLKKFDSGKLVVVRGDNGKSIIATEVEAKVFKNNYLWLEKRNKLQAANSFKYSISKELNKEMEYINSLNERSQILDKYFDTRR